MAIIENDDPFRNQDIFQLFEQSKTTSAETGWIEHHLTHNESFLPGFIKSHSYGEYIFDWAWAKFYHHSGHSYYPKLIHSIPFTPVNVPKFLGNKKDRNELANKSWESYQKSPSISGEHYLFINQEEKEILSQLPFEFMETHQFHWFNKYQSFDHFLDELKKSRRKMIKKERAKINQTALKIKCYQDKDLDKISIPEVYQLYLSTIDKKNAYAYLNLDFFMLLKERMRNNLIIFAAYKKDHLIAMSLFLKSTETLYGRYWGIYPAFAKEYPLLHFELCYYQGMEYCLNNNIGLFQAGAQGEHKLWRGFKPVTIYSAHHLKNEHLFLPIKSYIQQNNIQNSEIITYYQGHLPFA